MSKSRKKVELFDPLKDMSEWARKFFPKNDRIQPNYEEKSHRDRWAKRVEENKIE